MTGIGPKAPGSRPGGQMDVYTALLLVAFLFLLAATIYVSYRSVAMFGGLLPPPGA